MEEYNGKLGYYITVSRSMVGDEMKTFTFLVKMSVNESFTESIRVSIVPVPDKKESISLIHDDFKCLSVEISQQLEYDDDGDEIEGTGEIVGHIDTLNYNQLCSMKSPLEKSEGRVMVMPVLELCKTIFGVTQFSLQDTSRFACNATVGKIWLQEHSMLVNGVSWYEKQFGARPKYEEDKKMLDDTKAILRSTVSKDKARMIVKEMKINNNIRMSHDMFKHFRSIIKKSIDLLTWNEMFKEISSVRVTDGEDGIGCEFFQDNMIRRLYEAGGRKSILGVHRIDEWVIDIDFGVPMSLQGYEKL